MSQLVFSEIGAQRSEQMNTAGNSTQARSVQWRPRSRLVRDARSSTESASTHLEIARLLLNYGRTEVARRRLERVVQKFGNTPAAAESRELLATIGVASSDRDAPDPDGPVEAG